MKIALFHLITVCMLSWHRAMTIDIPVVAIPANGIDVNACLAED